MKIVCISDTHNQHRKMQIPNGDLLIHAGDLSGHGKESEIEDFNAWLGTLPHKYKVIIAGNHDFLFERNPLKAEKLISNAVYLNDSSVTIEGFKIWGSPISPWFYDWAFNRHRGEDIRKHWDLIAEDTDILITHGPPFGILDETLRGEAVGCEELAAKIELIKPRLHIFGHIHEARGLQKQKETTYINASMVDFYYKPVHQAFVIDLD